MKIDRNCKGKSNGNGSVRCIVLAAALSIGLGFGTHASAVDDSYLIDLKTGTATGLGNLTAYAINDAGQVVAGTGADHLVITGPNGVGMTALGTLGGSEFADGINASGQVVGESFTVVDDAQKFHEHAFITGPNGVGIRNLDTLEGVEPTGINAAGQVVGWFHTATGVDHAFITGPNGMGMTDLGTLGGANTSYANNINDVGQVVGSTSLGLSGAFITGTNGVSMIELGTLGGNGSFPTGINASGQVTGWSDTAAGQSHAFITGPNGVGMTDLGTLGGDESLANSINDAGRVVGLSDTAAGHLDHPFITGPNGAGMTDLNSLVHLPAGVVLTDPLDINNMGQIIAIASFVGVVPEPESYVLMLAGLTLMGAMVRRKQKG